MVWRGVVCVEVRRSRWGQEQCGAGGGMGADLVALVALRRAPGIALLVAVLALAAGPPCAADEGDLTGKELNVAEDIACGMCDRIVVRYYWCRLLLAMTTVHCLLE